MFIVNQSKNITVNLRNTIEIEVDGKQILADGGLLGRYETEERAKEVYKEMLEVLFSPYLVLKNTEAPSDELKNFANGNVILLKSADREPEAKFYDNGLYYMPEE